MHDMWAAASKIYTSLLDDPPFSAEVCSCLVDVENNGIFFHLRNIAILIREPELGYNKENLRQGRARTKPYTGETYFIGHGGKGSVLAKTKREVEEEPVQHDK